ncbi:MAG: Ribulose-phosphate 3-epimerase, partial [uncultured Rubrobacteraceae bacterium]
GFLGRAWWKGRGRALDTGGGLREPGRGGAAGAGRRGRARPLRLHGQPVRPEPHRRPRRRGFPRRGHRPAGGRAPYGGQPGQPDPAVHRGGGREHLGPARGRDPPAPDAYHDPGRRLRGRRRPQPDHPARVYRVGAPVPGLRARDDREPGLRRPVLYPGDGREGAPPQGDDGPPRPGRRRHHGRDRPRDGRGRRPGARRRLRSLQGRPRHRDAPHHRRRPRGLV